MKTKLTHLFTAALLGLTLAACSTAAPGTAAEKAKPYPLKVCIVSGNDLDSMGGPITKVHEGQEIKFCCKPCIKKFDANPAKYLGKLK
jgi:YHS domain-containing protein